MTSLAGRPALAGFTAQLRTSVLSPLAIVSAAISPTAYGVTVIAGYGKPTGSLLLGCIATGVWASLYAQSALIIVVERGLGTLQLLAASPVRMAAPLLGRMLGAGCQSLTVGPLVAVAIVGLFGGIEYFELPLFVAALGPVAVGLLGMSVCLMGVLARYRYSAGMVNGLFGSIVLLGGFFVPPSAMPFGLSAITLALPSTWAIQATRPAVAHPWTDLVIATLLGAGWLALGAVYLSSAQRRLRKSGFYQN